VVYNERCRHQHKHPKLESCFGGCYPLKKVIELGTPRGPLYCVPIVKKPKG
jgi:hypothetical protein